MAVVREVNWLELPDHLTVLFTNKLSRCDFIRFGAVCKSWLSILVTHPRRSVLHKLPLLLCSCSEDTNDIHNIYECIEKRTYNYQVLVPHANHTIGISHGWVITKCIDDEEVAVRIFLTNPFLTAFDNTIKLPVLSQELVFDEVDKVVLSANPASNPNYVVMVILSKWGKLLAFYNPSTDKDDWTYVQPTTINFDDALYYRDQFYLVDNSGKLFTYDFNNHPDDHDPDDDTDDGLSLVLDQHDKDMSKNRYLAELSSGDLILVTRLRKYVRVDCDLYYSCYTIGFSVYKMNPLVDLKWMEVQNLCGDTLFVDNWKCSSFKASDFPGCKPNCICFIDGGYAYFPKDDVWRETEHI